MGNSGSSGSTEAVEGRCGIGFLRCGPGNRTLLEVGVLKYLEGSMERDTKRMIWNIMYLEDSRRFHLLECSVRWLYFLV